MTLKRRCHAYVNTFAFLLGWASWMTPSEWTQTTNVLTCLLSRALRWATHICTRATMRFVYRTAAALTTMKCGQPGADATLAMSHFKRAAKLFAIDLKISQRPIYRES